MENINIKADIITALQTSMTSDSIWVDFSTIQSKLPQYDKKDILSNIIVLYLNTDIYMKIDETNLDIEEQLLYIINMKDVSDILKYFSEISNMLLFCDISRKEYLANIHFNKLKIDAISEMQELLEIYVKNEEYEKAAEYRDKIQELLNNKTSK